MAIFAKFLTSETDIINNKKVGVVYVADFPQGAGKYISVTEYGSKDAPDLDVKISSRIHLRVTYLTNAEKINGVEISKVDGDKIEKIHFSTLDFERILQLLSLFADLDLKAVSNKAVILEESIIGNPDEVTRFLTLIASDPEGKKKLGEVAKNYSLITAGDIDHMVQKKESAQLFERILNNPNEFTKYKSELGVAKDEEVWQRFFSINSWILGSDFVEILDERRLDVENITDYLLKSYDGFVDIIELKLPSAVFWTTENIPKSELTAASMQCNRYILQTERKINDLEFSKRIKATPIVKPRITLVYGRSCDWDENKREAYRVLNASYSDLNIVTYDHLLERAKRLVGLSVPEVVPDDGLTLVKAPF